MPVTIKSAREIELMRAAGKILGKVHQDLKKELRPGMTTLEIDCLGEEMIRSYGCIPSFKNYQGFPASVCVSVNDEVVNGIPSKKRIIKEGDIVSLDIGVNYKGYHSDAARTHAIGEISKEASELILHTRECFFAGIRYAAAGCYLHQMSAAIHKQAKSYGYGVVRDLVGHGIGSHLHEEPQVPNFRKPTRGIRLRPGMTLAVEPMINEGTGNVTWLQNQWTVVTRDHKLSAHYENTILITKGVPEILSITEDEIAEGVWIPGGTA